MKPLQDSQFESIGYQLSEREHLYGKNVHILSDPFLHTHLAKLCDSGTFQPVMNELVTTLYSSLLKIVVNAEFPQTRQVTHSRMAEFHSEGHFESPILDPDTPVISVNLARAGTVPSHVCYSSLNYFMNPKTVRQDHISIARKTNDSHQVTGSDVSGHKIGGTVDQAIVLFPDPMGATGSTIIEAVDLFKNYGSAKKYIAIHCIVTPEYLKAVKAKHPELVVYAIRLDRGLSSDKVLASVPGTFWHDERGLNDKHYIVPGGGGFGEILNNSYV
jgi:uracil phosphoribosyltransferase